MGINFHLENTRNRFTLGLNTSYFLLSLESIISAEMFVQMINLVRILYSTAILNDYEHVYWLLEHIIISYLKLVVLCRSKSWNAALKITDRST